MLNFRVLYMPYDDATVACRAGVGGQVNPLLHSEFNFLNFNGLATSHTSTVQDSLISALDADFFNSKKSGANELVQIPSISDFHWQNYQTVDCRVFPDPSTNGSPTVAHESASHPVSDIFGHNFQKSVSILTETDFAKSKMDAAFRNQNESSHQKCSSGESQCSEYTPSHQSFESKLVGPKDDSYSFERKSTKNCISGLSPRPYKNESKYYERQNIFYKALLRDFRRFIAEDFGKQTGYFDLPRKSRK